MKIVHELTQLDHGGVEKVIKNIIEYDLENEHTIVAYKDGTYKKKLEDAGAKIILACDEDVGVDADVIHIHTGGGISQLAHQLSTRFPIVETIHSPVRSPMSNMTITQRIGVTDVVSRMNSNCKTIHNGLAFSDMIPTKTPAEVIEELGIDSEIPIVGRLGRLGRDKGLEDWILTCYELQKQGVIFTPMVIGGEARGCNGYRGKLKLLAASLPVKDIVWVDTTDDIANYLQLMEVFLYPSPTEGFGLVLIEAMYSGCVVVSYDNEVNQELIAGYSILTDRSIAGLVKGTLKALDTNYQDALSGISRDWVKDKYDAAVMSQNYQDVYKEVLKKWDIKHERSNQHTDSCCQS